jgi:hypothetical protein
VEVDMRQHARRFNTNLSKEQLCFLDGISKEARFSGGKKLSRAAVMRALLRVAQDLKVDVSGVRSEEKLEERFVEVFRGKGLAR